uniref:Putative E3 ubiquitin-protein ligase HERC4 n=1 Tax=Lygus hesperus TaxID=30085 RepID=A0A0A9W9J1_LYGHE
MEFSSLKKLEILKHMTDEELRNIKYLQVYGSGAFGRYSTDRSALFVTHDDEVFLTGVNSMVGLLPAVPRVNKEASQGKCIKVDALSGLGIIKIVVGSSIGAALSSKGEVYTWGYVEYPVVNVTDGDTKMYESYVANKTCERCSRHNYAQLLIGSTSISRCGCGYWPNHSPYSPPSFDTTVRRFVSFSVPVLCPKCENPTSPKVLDYSNKFHFCPKCNMMLEVPGSDKINNFLLTKSSFGTLPPQKLEICESWKIRNIYCGASFLVMETSSDRLLTKGKIGNSETQFFIFNPDNVRFKSVSCGGDHLAVISDKGELYTCGLGDKGQLGYVGLMIWAI